MIVQLDQMDPRLRPGMNTTVRVAVDRVADAVLDSRARGLREERPIGGLRLAHARRLG